MTTTRIRTLAEVAVPGVASGVVAGIIVAGLAALVGQPLGWAMLSALTLGLPMAVLGGGYGMLVASGLVRLGVFAPAAIYWLVGFPLARLLHETVTPYLLGGPLNPPEDLLGFLVYQGLVSLGFAVGFIWLNERLAPRWLLRIKDHNSVAHQLFYTYARQAEEMESRRRRPPGGPFRGGPFRGRGQAGTTADGRSSRPRRM